MRSCPLSNCANLRSFYAPFRYKDPVRILFCLLGSTTIFVHRTSPTHHTMGFDEKLKIMLEKYPCSTLDPPYYKIFGPWNAVLSTIFPPSKGYMVELVSQATRADVGGDDLLEVRRLCKGEEGGWNTKKVLCLYSRGARHWPAGADVFERFIHRLLQEEIQSSVLEDVYWIATIGSHWRYGKMINLEDVEDPGTEDTMLRLIDWQDTIYDETSYDHLCALAREIDQN